MQRYTRTVIISLGISALLLILFLFWPLSAELTERSAILTTQVVDRNGVLLREIRPEGRGIPISLEEVAPGVIDALLSIEDRNFLRHVGVDPFALARAARDNVFAGEIVSGGSTLTMQIARNLRGHSSRSILHKIIEAGLALRLDAQLSKDELLTIWLNRAYFGNQAYGIEAAAQLYLKKSASDVTVSEAAYLVGLPQNPVGYDPFRFPERAEERHLRVLQALYETGNISKKTHKDLEAIPVQIVPAQQIFKAPHFVEFIRSTLLPSDQQNVTITTTLDYTLQEEVEALSRSHLQRLNSEYVTNAAVVVIENMTGHVLAYMGSVDFWNERNGGQNDGVRMLRQPGSALKPFTFALALQSGKYSPATILPDIETQIPEAGGAFSPQNYDKKYHGPVPLRDALANSYNVPAVRLAREIGAAPLLSSLQDFGFASLHRSAEHYGVGLTLGNGEVRLLELATAYSSLARMGKHIDPVFRSEAARSEPSETMQYVQPDNQPIVTHPDVAFLITDILSDPEARSAAFGRYGPLELPFPTAVKTGTSKDYRDNWAVGYTPRHTVAVWVGNFDGSPMQRVSGVSGAGPLFKSILLHLGSSGKFDQPAGIVSHVICPVSGQKPTAICPHNKRELFLPITAPTDTCSYHQRVEIDTRSQLLAHEHTPSQFIKSETYTVFPEMYHPWMRDQGLSFPPTTFSEWAIHRDSVAAEDTEVQIAYPVSGMIFQIDPILREGFQRIELKGVIPQGYAQAEWWINGNLWDEDYENASWPIEPGTHIFELRARTGNGAWIHSPSTTIQVVK